MKGIQFAILVQKLRRFGWMGGFYLLVELYREGSAGKKCPVSHPRHIFVKIIYFFKFTLIKSTQWNNLRFSPKTCTRIFYNINFWLQGLQIRAFQQRYLKCKCETPYFESELVPKTCKSWKMSYKKKFLSGLVTKLENLFVFGKNLWKISSNWWFQKKLLTDLTSAQTLKVCYIQFCPLLDCFARPQN